MNTLKIDIEGATHTLKEWADISGVSPDTIRGRYNRGWRGKTLIQVSRTYSQKKRRSEIRETCMRTDCFNCPYDDCVNGDPPYPEVRYTQGDEPMCIARYTLAVDRRYHRQNDDQTADFIRCVAFGKGGEFTEKYLKKGMKICVSGRIQTGSYTNREGQHPVVKLRFAHP